MKFREMNRLIDGVCRTKQNTDYIPKLLYELGLKVNFKSKEEKENYGELVGCYRLIHEKEFSPEIKALQETFESHLLETKEDIMTL